MYNAIEVLWYGVWWFAVFVMNSTQLYSACKKCDILYKIF